MKKMKKLLAGFMAATMVMSMSVTAFADENDYNYGYNGNTAITEQPNGETGEYTDVDSVDLVKLYTLRSDGIKNPAEDFEFYIEPYSVTDAGKNTSGQDIDVTNMPMFTSDETYTVNEKDYPKYTISYELGEATKDGDKNTVSLELPNFDTVGIYTYKITEISGNTAGVTYDGNSIYLKVTVIEQEGLVRVVALHYENEAGSKVENIKNEYAAGSLAVTKIVTGNMGDQTKEFTVTVTFKSPEDGSVVMSDIYHNGKGEFTEDNQRIWLSGDWVGTKETTITLKHDETYEFYNIPYGVTYTVVEDDYTSDGYTATYNNDADDDTTENDAANINDALDKVVITNEKGVTVDTGISLDNMPYIMVLALVALGLVGFVSKKRSMEF